MADEKTTATTDEEEAPTPQKNTEPQGDEPPKKTKKNKQPDGQTVTGSPEIGDENDDFHDTVTAVEGQRGRAVTRDTRVETEDETEVPKLFVQLTKALGLKQSQLLSYNHRTRIAVYDNGGKYQVSKNGKSVRHHSGPPPPPGIKLNVVDATHQGFSGTAAALNAPLVVPDSTPDNLRARREALEAEIAAIDEQLEE